MSDLIKIIESEYAGVISKYPSFNPGDTIVVAYKIREGNKERIQKFQGAVIQIKNKSTNGHSFTVRKVSNGVGVERVFPFLSPNIESIEVVRRGKVRRAKLYYLRGRQGKSARIKEKMR